MGKHNSDATQGGTATLTMSRPTFAGGLRPVFGGQFQQVDTPLVPEFGRLPSPNERCVFSGASRTWLIEHDSEGKYLVRVRQRGKLRGTVFVNVPKLLAYIRAAGNETVVEPAVCETEGGK